MNSWQQYVDTINLPPQTGDILGFKINDSGVPPSGDSNRFVEAPKMSVAWFGTEPGSYGTMVATDLVKEPAGPSASAPHV